MENYVYKHCRLCNQLNCTYTVVSVLDSFSGFIDSIEVFSIFAPKSDNVCMSFSSTRYYGLKTMFVLLGHGDRSDKI
jgi:hypothetical protein